MNSDLRFRFSIDKLLNALAHFAASRVVGLTKLKAVKMLYLADRYHLHRHGRPITGDRYIAMDLGPVPEDSYQLIGRLLQPVEVDDSALEKALEVLQVDRGFLNRYKYPILRARKAPNLDVFSDSEIEALNQVIAEHRSTSARDLVDLTHTHQAYLQADLCRAPGSSVDLPYEFFFNDAPSDLQETARARAESFGEAHAFAAALHAAGNEARDNKRRKLVGA